MLFYFLWIIIVLNVDCHHRLMLQEEAHRCTGRLLHFIKISMSLVWVLIHAGSHKCSNTRSVDLVWLQELPFPPVQDQDGLFPWMVVAGPMLTCLPLLSLLSLHPSCCFLKAQTNCVLRSRLTRLEPTEHLNRWAKHSSQLAGTPGVWSQILCPLLEGEGKPETMTWVLRWNLQ